MTDYVSLATKFKGIPRSDLPKYLVVRGGQAGFNLPSGFVSAEEIDKAMLNLHADQAINNALLKADINMYESSVVGMNAMANRSPIARSLIKESLS
jgi:hypothetical protein